MVLISACEVRRDKRARESTRWVMPWVFPKQATGNVTVLGRSTLLSVIPVYRDSDVEDQPNNLERLSRLGVMLRR